MKYTCLLKKLTKEAFNALLKTLEEPPEHAIFILATTELHKVPDTIVSRTQHFPFRKISIPDIVGELKKISKSEKIVAEEDALKLIAFFAEGSLRDAENTLFQFASSGENGIKEKDARALLGAPEEEMVNNLTTAVLSGEVTEALEIYEKVLDSGVEAKLLGRLLLRNFRAIYFVALDPKTVNLLQHEFAPHEIDFFKGLAKNVAQLELAVRQVLETLYMPVDDASSHIPLELALIKIATYK